MFEPVSLLLIVLWLFWLGLGLFACRNVFAFQYRQLRALHRPQEPYAPPVAIIVPVKGDHKLLAHLRGLMAQQYPQYRLIFTVGSMDDPAYRAIRDYCGTSSKVSRVLNLGRPHGDRISPGLVNVMLVSAGPTYGRAQKMHNQIAAYEQINRHDEVVVFADADAVMNPDWLVKLVRPLGQPSIGLTTAWRWLVPSGPSLANVMVSIINSSIVTLLGRDRRNHAWGGSMAARREVLEAIGMPKPWEDVFNDDVTLSHAVRTAGYRVHLAKEILVPAEADYTWASAIEFGRRQYLHARFYVGPQWWWAPIGTTLYLAGWLSAVIKGLSFTPGWGWAWGVLLAMMGMDLIRAIYREKVARQSFDEPTLAKLDRVWWWERLGTPIWMAMHWVVCVSAMFGRTLRWGGITYEIQSPHNVRVVSRSS